MIKSLCLGLLLICSIGCSKKVAVHPGAISNLDSYAYDLLLVEQGTILQAKTEFAAGQIPASVKTALNDAIDQFNITQDAWQVYHAGGQNQAALQSALDALVTVMGDLAKLLPNKGLAPVIKSSEVNYVNVSRAA